MAQPLHLTPDLSQPSPGADAALASGWTWKDGREACDRHKRGNFYLSWQLTIDAPSSPAIRAAEGQRLASPCGLPWEVCGPSRAPARLETEAARWTWERHLRRLLRSSLRDVAYMGFSVWQHPTAVNPITLRREITAVERWPLSQVRYTAVPFMDPWNAGKWIFGYYALQFGVGESLGDVLWGNHSGAGIGIKFIQLPRPGETDGHWTILGEGDQPHLNGAIVSLDTPYVAGQLSPRARANLIKNLGRQSPVVTMPDGMKTTDPEGKAAKEVVNGLGIDRDGAVLPGGAKLGGFSPVTPTASFFVDDGNLTERAVAFALLGRAGSLGKTDAQYVSPVEAEVPEALVRADVGVIERSVSSLLQLIADQNTPKPGRIYLTGHLPDTEQEARVKAKQERDQREADKVAKFHAALLAERTNGFEPDQDRVNDLAAACGVKAPTVPTKGLPPILVKVPAPTVPITGQDAAPSPAPTSSPRG